MLVQHSYLQKYGPEKLNVDLTMTDGIITSFEYNSNVVSLSLGEGRKGEAAPCPPKGGSETRLYKYSYWSAQHDDIVYL